MKMEKQFAQTTTEKERFENREKDTQEQIQHVLNVLQTYETLEKTIDYLTEGIQPGAKHSITSEENKLRDFAEFVNSEDGKKIAKPDSVVDWPEFFKGKKAGLNEFKKQLENLKTHSHDSSMDDYEDKLKNLKRAGINRFLREQQILLNYFDLKRFEEKINQEEMPVVAGKLIEEEPEILDLEDLGAEEIIEKPNQQI